MSYLWHIRASVAIVAMFLCSSVAIAGTPTVKTMQYVAHWANESDPWANITVTVTPPDDGAALPSVARVQIKTVYVLDTRKDLFCHIKNYFAYSSVTNLDGAGWNALDTKLGTTTGCPTGSQPIHVVEFDLPLSTGNGQHSLTFHIYSDGFSGFCPRPSSRQRASLRISGTIGWNSTVGTLQSSNVVIDPLAQPHNLSGCTNQAANSQNANFPNRVIERPGSFDTNSCGIVFADSSHNSGERNGTKSCACIEVCDPARNPSCVRICYGRLRLQPRNRIHQRCR